ncbi:electron transport complex subunit RsxG [Endothiovibrio diazotrophicus]
MAQGVLVPSYRQRIGYHAMLLGGIALLASMLLTIGANQTSEDIALRQAEDLRASLSQVVPDTVHDNNLLEGSLSLAGPHGEPLTVYRARMGGEVTAVAFEISEVGYAGPVVSMIGIDRSGAILGVRVLQHAETPGLGDKIEAAKDDWILGFDGLSLGNPPVEKWKVKKDGGQFDQFSGATITPRAVVKSIKGGLDFFAQHRDELLTVKDAS